MSFYDDASLIMYPSGYKADKIYSLKPTDGSGDLTFTRASTATRVNESGLIESVATGVPRIDYTGGGCGKFLFEPQRTNLITYSEDFADAYWTTTNASIDSNVGVAPDGTTTADRLVPDTSLATKHLISKSSQAIECYSIFAKADGFNWLLLTSHSSSAPKARGTFFDLENGVIGEKGSDQTAWMEDYGNGWWKCSIDAGSSSSSIYSAFCCEADDDFNIAEPNGTDGIQIWGAENQDGVYPTSYIPTAGATATRVADSASKTGISSLIGQTEGTLFIKMAALADASGNRFISLSDGTLDNRVSIGYTVTSNQIQYFIKSGGVTQATDSSTISDVTDLRGIAVKYKENDFAVWVDGVEVLTDSSGVTFGAGILTNLVMTSGNASTNRFDGKIQELMLFPTALTDTQLAILTTP